MLLRPIPIKIGFWEQKISHAYHAIKLTFLLACW